MSWMSEIAALRREIRDRFEQLPSALFGWTLTAKSSSMGDADQAQTSDTTESQRPVRRVEPWGHRGRPPGKIRSLWIRLGSSNVLFIGVAPTKGYGPNDLDDGETAVYNITKALVRLWKSGKITLDSDNEDVVVNGGTKKVARVDDTLTASTALGTWAGAVESAISGLGGVVPPTTFSSAAGQAGALGKIATGAANFKG